MIETEKQTHETRDRIFAAAARLFAERGIGSVSMREIAETAGVSKPMLYYYFDSKLGLCKALLDEGINCMVRVTSDIASRPIPVADKLEQMIRARFRYIEENPDIFKFYLNFLHGPDETGLVKEYRARIHHASRVITDLIAEGQARGELRSDVDPSLAANAYAGTVNFHVAHGILFETPTLDEALARTIVDMFVNGMKA